MAEPETAENDIKTLMEISGLKNEDALKLLRLKNNNLQEAIFFHLDGGSIEELAQYSSAIDATTVAPQKPPDAPIFFDDGVEVRAPIPKKQEILLPPEEGLHGLHYRLRQNHRQTINPFRNFAYESENFVPDAKRSRLEDLFRPPIDLICPGSFSVVKEYAQSKNRWLLINVQDDSEFTSQILYRDIWSNINLKGLIKSHMVFWQTGTDTVEGNRVKVYYNAHHCPYVAIIDPRTGEEMQGWRSTFPYTAEQFVEVLETFLLEHGANPEKNEEEVVVDEEPIASTSSNHKISRRRPKDQGDDDNEASCSRKKKSTTINLDLLKKSVINLTEEEQLELALKQSLQETCFRDSKSNSQSPLPELSSDSSDFEEPAEADENVDDDNVKKFMEPAKLNETDNTSVCDDEIDESGPKTRLMIKLPEGKTEIINWPAEAKIRGLKRHLNERYSTKDRKLKTFCPTIRKDLLELDEQLTLIKAQLHPSCVIHLYPDN